MLPYDFMELVMKNMFKLISKQSVSLVLNILFTKKTAHFWLLEGWQVESTSQASKS